MSQAITPGALVRISYGPRRGYRGEVIKIEGRHITVSTVGGNVTLLASQLELV
jgi:hypothetical protein